MTVSQDTILLAAISDRIDALRYSFSSESKRMKEFPSLVRLLMGEEKDSNSEAMTFDSPEDLMKALAKARGE